METLPTWLTENERLVLQAFVTALYERYGEKILSVQLFGSKARGDFDADSDLDVLVLTTHDDWRFQQAISFLAAGISLVYNLILAPKVINLVRWEFLNREEFAIARNVQQEGIVLGSVQSVTS